MNRSSKILSKCNGSRRAQRQFFADRFRANSQTAWSQGDGSLETRAIWICKKRRQKKSGRPRYFTTSLTEIFRKSFTAQSGLRDSSIYRQRAPPVATARTLALIARPQRMSKGVSPMTRISSSRRFFPGGGDRVHARRRQSDRGLRRRPQRRRFQIPSTNQNGGSLISAPSRMLPVSRPRTGGRGSAFNAPMNSQMPGHASVWL